MSAPAKPNRRAKARITVIDKAYHQVYGDQPTSCEHTFRRELDVDDQPYARKGKATEEWSSLEVGWINKCAMILVCNEEGRFTKNPTDEERAATAAKVIQVRFKGDTGLWLLRPGESMRATPEHLEDVMVRSCSGVTKFSYTLYPG